MQTKRLAHEKMYGLWGLIQHDLAEAHEYLNRFVAFYRFLIRHKDDDFVTPAGELQFVDEYTNLLRHHFGAAYEFRQELPTAAELHRLLVVPEQRHRLFAQAVRLCTVSGSTGQVPAADRGPMPGPEVLRVLAQALRSPPGPQYKQRSSARMRNCLYVQADAGVAFAVDATRATRWPLPWPR